MYKMEINRRFLLYIFVGVIIYIFQLLLNVVLVEMYGVLPVSAFYISFPFILVLSYFFHVRLTYSDKISNLNSFLLYALNAIFMALLGGAGHFILVYFNVNYILSLMLIMLCMALLSFLIGNHMIFKSKKDQNNLFF
jgi:putative flippase GtrA